MFQYANLRACAERDGVPFHHGKGWIGEKIFNLPSVPSTPGRDTGGGYGSKQEAVFYTRRDALRWFAFRPEVAEMLKRIPLPVYMAHHRLGDYIGQPIQPVVSYKSYVDGIKKFGYNLEDFYICTEENPCIVPGFEQFPFLPDFYRLMKAEVLFRGNSSFSWWAAALGDGKVYAPVVTGCKAGVLNDVEFVEGNYPSICDSEHCSDIHLKP